MSENNVRILQPRRAEIVEPARVAVQYGGFVGIRYVRVFEHLVDLVFAEIVVDLMREIAGVNPRFVADSFNRVGDVRLFALATDEDAAGVDMARDVFADFFFRFEIEKTFTRIMLNVGFP